MVGPIDPATGAPTVSSGDTLDQLPYNTQPVPYDDLTQLTDAPRGLSYPDDVPPVLANLNGMDHTNPRKAQTVHTDGNHALLVSDVSGGGGGGGGAASLQVSFPANTRINWNYSGTTALDFPVEPADVILYYLQYDVLVESAPGAHDNLQLYLFGNSSGNKWYIFDLSVPSAIAAAQLPLHFHGEYGYDYGLDLRPYFTAGETLALHFTSGIGETIDLGLVMMLYSSNGGPT